MKSTPLQSSLVSLAIVMAAVSVQAQANSWTNSASGKWETPANWSLGIAPTNGQSIIITNASTKTLTLDIVTPAGNLVVSNLSISGNGTTTNTLTIVSVPTRSS